jgi:hypothetical protein
MHPGPNVTVEEGSSLGGFRAKPNALNHLSFDLGSPTAGHPRPPEPRQPFQASDSSSIRFARR